MCRPFFLVQCLGHAVELHRQLDSFQAFEHCRSHRAVAKPHDLRRGAAAAKKLDAYMDELVRQ